MKRYSALISKTTLSQSFDFPLIFGWNFYGPTMFFQILSELRSHNIPIYQFPTDDETVRTVNTELNQLVPYAVVGSTDFVKKENGKMVRARRYPWGMVEGVYFFLNTPFL